jgi:hypothetical protein
VTAAELTAKYPPWHVFCSSTGRYWAARATNEIPGVRPGGGFTGSGETVDADDDAAMGELLAARSTP